MKMQMIALAGKSTSVLAEFVIFGIGFLVGAAIMAGAYYQRKVVASQWDEINPLDESRSSKVKRAYYESSRLRAPLYVAGGLACIGIVLLVTAGLLALIQ
jgi:hypothetical protein